MSTKKRLGFSINLCLAIALMTLSACVPAAAPEVQKPVEQTVIVEKEKVVEKTVVETVVVETEKIVVATPEPKVIRVAVPRFGVTADISTSTGGGYETLSNVFESLTAIDPRTNEVVPAAAEKWEASADGTVYTFTLRSGMTWTDGKPVTAGDFEYSWKRTLSPEVSGRMAFVMYGIKNAEAYNKGEAEADTLGVKALDDSTLVVTLEQPSSYLPSMVAMVLYAPLPKWCIDANGDKWVEPGTIVTNGPYMFDSWKPDQEVVLVRNPTYWGEQTGVDKAIFTVFESVSPQGLSAYENDELDVTAVGADDLERVREDAVLSKELQVDAGCGVTTLALDTMSAPLNDPKVRQALSLGIDRIALASAVYKDAMTPADTIIPVGIDGRNPNAALQGGIPQAQKLLAEAGYPGGAGFPEIQYVTGSDAESKLMAEFVQYQWQTNLGITLKLNFMESAAFGEWRRATKTNKDPYNGVVLRGWTADYLDATDWFNSILDSSADYWDTRWKNDEFDTLVRAAAGELDPAKRRQMYQDAETIVMQDSPAIPLVSSTYYTMIKPNVSGVFMGPSSMGRIFPLRFVEVY